MSVKTIKQMAILTDVTKCIGCEECVQACQQVNKLPPEMPWRWLDHPEDLSSSRWTTIHEMRTDKGRRFVRQQCRHCLEPACVEACIVGALKKTAAGAVKYDPEICIGCRYCMVACPWEIPRYSWEEQVPYIQKCTFCFDRVKTEGKAPACTAACPTKATIFGEREELLAEARRRLAAQPDTYIQKIWGEKEVGGTSVIYISDVDLQLDELTAPITDATPVPKRTFRVLSKMPMVFVGMAALMGATYWTIERRQKLQAKEAEEQKGEEAAALPNNEGEEQKDNKGEEE